MSTSGASADPVPPHRVIPLAMIAVSGILSRGLGMYFYSEAIHRAGSGKAIPEPEQIVTGFPPLNKGGHDSSIKATGLPSGTPTDLATGLHLAVSRRSVGTLSFSSGSVRVS